ncbi:cyclic nucleotide-binding domain-containing protein [Paenibacillus sp. NPDC056579]|uniref:cyclic nucleotide-binding domain-containing protein n=1 Tax=Paenibacillus sp. NPDC056579 TaxID=3345871 RepID=UPI0036D1EF38
MSFDIVEFLKNHTLLHGVPEMELAKAASTMQTVRFTEGEWLMHEGKEGHHCYFVLEGTVQVHTRSLIGKQVVLAELGYGALIGEIALIRNEKRTAGIRALNDVTALCLDRAAFEKLAEASPHFHESMTYAAELRMKHGMLSKASIWSAIPDSELRGLAEITVRRRVKRGETVLREGDPADTFYMISSGRFELRSASERRTVLGTGDYFGEIAMLTLQPQTVSAVALEDSELLVMGRTEFQAILSYYPPVRRQFAEVLRIRRPDLSMDASYGSLEKDGQEAAVSSRRVPSDTGGKVSRRPARWIDLLFVLGGAFVGCTVLAVWTQHPLWRIAALLVGGMVGPVTFVAYVRSSQLLGFSPARLASVFLSSAAVAVPLAWMAERHWLFARTDSAGFSEWTVPLSVAFIEEAAKLIVCAVLLRGGRMRFLMDAVVFGAAAGMGFAAIESIVYGWSYGGQGATGDMLAVLWVRTLLSPLGHGTWTAIAAAGIWYGYNRRSAALARGSRAWLLALALPLSAVLLHMLWDYHFMVGIWRMLSMVTVGAGGLLILYLLIRKGARDEDMAVTALNPLLQHEAADEAPGLGEQQEAKARSPLICSACRTQSPPDARYCARCGQALKLGRQSG